MDLDKRLAQQWGQNVATRRAALTPRMTQTELARIVDVEQNTVSRWETGTVCPSEEMKLRIAVATDASVDELFGWPFGIDDLARNSYPTRDEAA